MKSDIIFIHIPKTGGTTINSAMKGTHWQTRPDFNYRHILPDTKESNSGDIFEPSNIEDFKPYKIFMMLRDPVDRLISEYYFIRERKEFMDLLRTKPKNFEDYIRSKQTQNGVVNFLRGKRMYDTRSATTSDLKEVIECIDSIPVHVGIFEEFEKSLLYFSDVSGIKWNRSIEVKRMTFLRPKASELEPRLVELIKQTNQLDVQLYEHCKQKFDELQLSPAKGTIEFVSDKYNHVVPYCNKWCFFEFCMDNKKFIQSNFEYFKALTFYLIREKQLSDGKDFTRSWNATFLKAVQDQFPGSNFSKKISSIYDESQDPLQQTINIAQEVDAYFNTYKKEANEFYTPLTFNKEDVIIHKEKKGVFSKLFGR